MDPLKAVVIGCGRMGAFTSPRVANSVPDGWLPLSHAEALRTLEGVELAGLCDISRESLDAAGRAYRVERLETDFRVLLADVKPDIVCVATRTPGRCEIIRHAAVGGARGIHAEKPLCNRLSEGRTTIGTVVDHASALTYGTVRRFMAAYRRARDVCRDGDIGEVTEVVIEHGETTLLWNHPHSADLLLFFADCVDVDWVQGACEIEEGAVEGQRLDGDPLVRHGYVQFANGITGIIGRGGGLNAHVHGSRGTVSVLGDGGRVVVRSRTAAGGPYLCDVTEIEVQPRRSGTQQALGELRDWVIHGTPVSMRPDEVIRGQEILFALVLSAQRQGSRVDPRSVDPEMEITGRSGSLFA